MANTFTPEQIAQILEEFFKTVGTRQYIGSRYVPLFGRKDEESIIWDNSKPYESLTVVLYQGNSYTSRQYVPEGVEITNQEFWANTGNYNAQIEQYRQETAQALQAAQAAQRDIDALLPKSEFSAENTVKDYIDNELSNKVNITDGYTLTEAGAYGFNTQTGSFYVITDTRNTQKAQHEISDGLYAEIIDGEYLFSDEKHVSPVSASQVANIANCAASYISRRDDFIYGGTYSAFRPNVVPVSGKWEINCSTFAMLLAYGIDFEHSAYALGTNNNKVSPLFWEETQILDWFSTENEGQSGDYRWKYTYDLAMYMYERGYCFEPNSELSNIQSGDLLFMKNQTGSEGISTFKDIDHSCIFGWWLTDNSYVVFEVGTLPSAQIYYKENLVSNLVLAARLPMATPNDDFAIWSYQQDPITTDNQLLGYVRCKTFEADTYYTLIAEIDYDSPINMHYPVIYQGATRVMGYDGAIANKPENNVFVIPFKPASLNENIAIRLNASASGLQQPTATLRNPIVVKGLITTPSISEAAPRSGIATAASGFTVENQSIHQPFMLGQIGGTFNAGSNIVATIDGIARYQDLQPVNGYVLTQTGVQHDVESYIDWRGGSANLVVRNDTGAALTGSLYFQLALLPR